MTSSVRILQIASILCAISVALGAFATHKLQADASASLIAIFQKGVYYQFMHSFALLILGFLLFCSKTSNVFSAISFYTFLGGIFAFSGSLYYITWFRISYGLDSSLHLFIVLLTPLGGMLFIAGWAMMFLYLIRLPRQ